MIWRPWKEIRRLQKIIDQLRSDQAMHLRLLAQGERAFIELKRKYDEERG
jgi:hypothetical protein